MRLYRVWTRNVRNCIILHTSWESRKECQKYVLGRWGHHPPFAYISRAKNVSTFRQRYGIGEEE